MIQIKVTCVTAVLLDQWYEVYPGTFDMDTGRFTDSATRSEYPVSSEFRGFTFHTREGDRKGDRVSGRSSAIRAVRHGLDPEPLPWTL